MERVEIKYFESAECNRLFYLWISNYPESFHSVDLDRFTEMVVCVLDNGDSIEYDYLKQFTKLNERMVDAYMNRYLAMRDMYMALRSRWSVEQ